MIEPNIDAETLDEACSDYNDLETRVVNILYILSLKPSLTYPLRQVRLPNLMLPEKSALTQ